MIRPGRWAATGAALGAAVAIGGGAPADLLPLTLLASGTVGGLGWALAIEDRRAAAARKQADDDDTAQIIRQIELTEAEIITLEAMPPSARTRRDLADARAVRRTLMDMLADLRTDNGDPF